MKTGFRTEVVGLAVAALLLLGAAAAQAQAQTGTAGADDAEQLAQQLANPVASLVSVPFQMNWDHGIGPDDNGRRYLLNFQPVLPFRLNDDWNLITRVIVPIIGQPVLFEGGDSSFGMGDILLSAFLSPSRGGLIWGVGPAVSLPVTSDPVIGSGKYSAGPSVVFLKQVGPWTVGALMNHVWSLGGDEGRKSVNQTFLQPFIAYARRGWTFSVNSESLANWEAPSGEHWTIPINLAVSKVVMLGRRPVSIGGGPRFYVESPEGGPSWGFRLAMTLLFPTGGGR